jgi:hypothetical protein
MAVELTAADAHQTLRINEHAIDGLGLQALLDPARMTPKQLQRTLDHLLTQTFPEG